jgi:hypothetical protein
MQAALGLEPLAGEAGSEGLPVEAVSVPKGSKLIVQTLAPLALVAKTGRPM